MFILLSIYRLSYNSSKRSSELIPRFLATSSSFSSEIEEACGNSPLI